MASESIENRQRWSRENKQNATRKLEQTGRVGSKRQTSNVKQRNIGGRCYSTFVRRASDRHTAQRYLCYLFIYYESLMFTQHANKAIKNKINDGTHVKLVRASVGWRVVLALRRIHEERRQRSSMSHDNKQTSIQTKRHKSASPRTKRKETD